MSAKALDKQIAVDGQFVSERVNQIVMAIRDYSPELEVSWIPPLKRDEGDAAFAIIHKAPGQPPYILFHVQTEEEFDIRVLQRIIANDQRTRPVLATEFEAWEEARARVAEQAAADAMEEAHDIARFVLKSPLNTMRINKNLVIRDYGGGRLD